MTVPPVRTIYISKTITQRIPDVFASTPNVKKKTATGYILSAVVTLCKLLKPAGVGGLPAASTPVGFRASRTTGCDSSIDPFPSLPPPPPRPCIPNPPPPRSLSREYSVATTRTTLLRPPTRLHCDDPHGSITTTHVTLLPPPRRHYYHHPDDPTTTTQATLLRPCYDPVTELLRPCYGIVTTTVRPPHVTTIYAAPSRLPKRFYHNPITTVHTFLTKPALY